VNANDTTEDRVTMLRELLDMTAQQIGEKRYRILELEELLERCADVLDSYSDVIDGDYGIPEPNKAMALLSEIRKEIT
jgi:uncharacterized membrane protein